MTQTTYIYVLIDCFGTPFYIGKTVNPKNRLNSHKGDFGPLTKMTILESVSPEINWRDSERKWISEYRRLGHRLLNISPGGTGRGSVALSTRKKLSHIIKNSKAAQIAVRKNADKSRGVPRLPEIAAKIGAGLKSSLKARAHRARLSESRKGSHRPAEVCKKISGTLTGRKQPQALVEKRSLTFQKMGWNKKRTPEFNLWCGRKRRADMKGIPFTDPKPSIYKVGNR